MKRACDTLCKAILLLALAAAAGCTAGRDADAHDPGSGQDVLAGDPDVPADAGDAATETDPDGTPPIDLAGDALHGDGNEPADAAGDAQGGDDPGTPDGTADDADPGRDAAVELVPFPDAIEEIAYVESCAGQPEGTPCGVERACRDGECTTLCLSGPCPSGLQAFDGCHCRPMPTGALLCTDLVDLVDCDTIRPGDRLYPQDGHWFQDDVAYEDLGDGTVRDLRSGLVWARDVAGPMSYEAAVDWCGLNQGGLPGEGWRMPRPLEVVGILRYAPGDCLQHPLLGETCPNRGWIWTDAMAGDWGACVMTSMGDLEGCRPRDSRSVRCVRGEGPVASPGERFWTIGDVVWDRVTGRAWDRVPRARDVTWPQALAHCLGRGRGWRLPTIKELATIIAWPDEPTSGIQPVFQIFEGRESYEWSSTPDPGFLIAVKAVHFASGHLHEAPADIPDPTYGWIFSARCINDRLPGP